MEKARKGSGNVDWFEAELADAIDEDYELELSEPALSMERSANLSEGAAALDPPCRLFPGAVGAQAELIRLQDWVSYHKEKVVVNFEGRDSACKGGVIKRHRPAPEPPDLPRSRAACPIRA